MNQSSGAHQQQQQQAPSRPISPAPKPDRLRSFKPLHETGPVPSKSPVKAPIKPPNRPPIERPPAAHEEGSDTPALPLASTRPPPAAKPQGLSIQTPSVTVQPPQSPPKGRLPVFTSVDQSPFLDPVSTIPSRPLTPIHPLTAPKSPRLASPQPPSPPPPRRSGEVRRDWGVKQPPPPTGPRLDRPVPTRQLPTNLPEPHGNHFVNKSEITKETSPFSSPPGSPGENDDGTPPDLPTRPRPQVQSDAHVKAQLSLGEFEPPPVHHSVAVKRMGRDQVINGSVKEQISPQRTGDYRVAQPSKPPTQDSLQILASNTIKAPPRPPRPIPRANTPKPEMLSSSAPPSRPAAQLTARQLPVPPVRQPVNTRTRDRTPERAWPEIKNNPSPIPATTKATVPTSAPETFASKTEPVSQTTSYPDGANANRRPPSVKKGCYEIQTKYDPRVFEVCGELICTSGHLTRVWNLLDGEQIMSLAHTEGVKATAVAFKPGAGVDAEGTMLWIGTNIGEIMEVEVDTQRILQSRAGVHGRAEVIKMHRHLNELWTFDEGGTLHVWGPDADGVPNLSSQPHQSYKLPKVHTFSMVVGDELWHATSKTIRVFAPSLDGSKPFQVLVRPLMADGAGDVTAGTQIKTQPGKVFFGHVDGKISMFSTADYSCLEVLNISSWKINALAGVGQYMWAGYNTGKMCVYDMSQRPWIMKKEWQAHDQPIMKMKADPASSYRLDRLQVVTLGGDNKVKVWDGLLEDDWLEEDMKSKDTKYCDFDEINAMVMTWNAGASTPHSLRYSDGDANFFQELVQSSGSPDIFIFGFQELVDLEDKRATAKRFLKSSKKKEGTDQERMSHQYRNWRDFLMKTLDDYMPADDLYHLLHSAPLVGLFTCVFVKSSLRERIRNLSAAEVKRGMGGLHGNKGAVVIRFHVDDTSLCFLNCHLAAGQSQSNSRHNDVAAILETSMFPAERDSTVQIDSYSGGGDGTMVLDHELCILNGDLNYRIDTMSRDTVVKAVQQQNLSKLLERDQLLVARRRNPAFRLRAFEEMPITFAPTYKYDVGTDNYDTSEKRRSPAWCDRLLFRGRGRVQQLDYKRHEVRVSDHRPVTGSFRLWVKKVDRRERHVAWMESQQGFEDLRQHEVADETVLYLVNTCGYDEAASSKYVKGNGSRRGQRSPSRNRSGY
ncbi:inositol polyphosphate 5-phosphatase [Tolypocladium capitatum]|uniref:Inositol polyphosphate 5-phosphatase n=1 Tax=Tolypocladium capitatum TaxID=45235 RepID=A0A2K3QF38_9HYPO|nr:inositol polyphosphate 5-phosphatase [Tolypocladium capitatum]